MVRRFRQHRADRQALRAPRLRREGRHLQELRLVARKVTQLPPLALGEARLLLVLLLRQVRLGAPPQEVLRPPA